MESILLSRGAACFARGGAPSVRKRPVFFFRQILIFKCGVLRPANSAPRGLPEQAPSFYVFSIVVRRADSTRSLAFLQLEACLSKTYQLFRQDQKAAIR